jgi:hypothetical protein
MIEPLAEDASAITSAIPRVSAHRSALRTNERTYFECDSLAFVAGRCGLAVTTAAAGSLQQVVALAHPARSAGRRMAFAASPLPIGPGPAMPVSSLRCEVRVQKNF